MTLFLFLLAVFAGLAWWVLQRSARMREEAAQREARALEALLAAPRAAGVGATVDTERPRAAESAARRESVPAPAPANADEEPIPVRDLVRTYYEARGYRTVEAVAEGPIDRVLRHKRDPRRAYAFAAIDGRLTAATAEALTAHLHRIGESRLLIAIDAGEAPPAVAPGMRVYDRAGIEAELAKIDAAAAQSILVAARRRARRRIASTA